MSLRVSQNKAELFNNSNKCFNSSSMTMRNTTKFACPRPLLDDPSNDINYTKGYFIITRKMKPIYYL